MDTCMCMADSFCCSLETITALFVNRLYSNAKLKIFKNENDLELQKHNHCLGGPTIVSKHPQVIIFQFLTNFPSTVLW